tara:strand:- start:861 stop:1277 length:417 start_codon:yes stop_codon:yes gene_type:complete
MQTYTNIEIDDDEIWEAVSVNVNDSISEQVPEHLTEIENRAEWLEEKYSELNYRTDELEDHETEDHEIRITDSESQIEELSEKVEELTMTLQPWEIIEELNQKVEELSEQLQRIKQLIPRDIIETILRDLLAEARITL